MRRRGEADLAIFHASTSPLSRSTGRSAVAAAAYRAGCALADERTGQLHDYERKRGVASSELVLPDGGAADREQLWNAAERAEKRKDARTAREWTVALPTELGAKERADLARAFAQAIAYRYGVAVDVAIHAPHRNGDERNWHAHLLTTTRQVTRDAEGRLVLGAKAAIELGDKDRKKAGLAGRSAQDIEQLRATWAVLANRALERVGRAERIDHRSLEAQGIDRQATTHLGPVATSIERSGRASDRGDLNRQVHRHNAEREKLAAELVELQRQHQAELRRQEREREEAQRRREEAEKAEAQRLEQLRREEVERIAREQAELRRREELERAEKAQRLAQELAAQAEARLTLREVLSDTSRFVGLTPDTQHRLIAQLEAQLRGQMPVSAQELHQQLPEVLEARERVAAARKRVDALQPAFSALPPASAWNSLWRPEDRLVREAYQRAREQLEEAQQTLRNTLEDKALLKQAADRASAHNLPLARAMDRLKQWRQHVNRAERAGVLERVLEQMQKAGRSVRLAEAKDCGELQVLKSAAVGTLRDGQKVYGMLAQDREGQVLLLDVQGVDATLHKPGQRVELKLGRDGQMELSRSRSRGIER